MTSGMSMREKKKNLLVRKKGKHPEKKMLNMIVKMTTLPMMEVPIYEGNLTFDELMDLINAMDKYFEYEDFDEEKKVTFVAIRLQGHATLW